MQYQEIYPQRSLLMTLIDSYEGIEALPDQRMLLISLKETFPKETSNSHSVENALERCLFPSQEEIAAELEQKMIEMFGDSMSKEKTSLIITQEMSIDLFNSLSTQMVVPQVRGGEDIMTRLRLRKRYISPELEKEAELELEKFGEHVLLPALSSLHPKIEGFLNQVISEKEPIKLSALKNNKSRQWEIKLQPTDNRHAELGFDQLIEDRKKLLEVVATTWQTTDKEVIKIILSKLAECYPSNGHSVSTKKFFELLIKNWTWDLHLQCLNKIRDLVLEHVKVAKNKTTKANTRIVKPTQKNFSLN